MLYKLSQLDWVESLYGDFWFYWEDFQGRQHFHHVNYSIIF